MTSVQKKSMETLLSLIDSIDSIFRSISTSKLSFFMSSIIRIYSTDEELDEKLKEYLDDPNSELYRINEYCVKFNDLNLWGANIPYACFSEYQLSLERWYEFSHSRKEKQLPSRTTCYRILKRLGEI